MIKYNIYKWKQSNIHNFLFASPLSISQTLSVSPGGQSRPLLLALDPLTVAFVATSRSLSACQAINTSLTLLSKHTRSRTHCPPLKESQVIQNKTLRPVIEHRLIESYSQLPLIPPQGWCPKEPVYMSDNVKAKPTWRLSFKMKAQLRHPWEQVEKAYTRNRIEL